MRNKFINATHILILLLFINQSMTAREIAAVLGISVNEVHAAIKFLRKSSVPIESACTRRGGYSIGGIFMICPYEPNYFVGIKGKKPTSPISADARALLNILNKANRLLTLRKLSILLGKDAAEVIKLIIELRAKGDEVYSFPSPCGGYGLPRKNFVKQNMLYRFAA